MGLHHSPRIVTDGLVLCLDASDRNSYPGNGNTWYDLSGNGFTFINDNATYNNSGYFSVSGNGGNLESRSISLSFSEITGITLEVWVKKNGNGSARQRIVELYNSSFSAADSHALIFETDNRLVGWLNDSSGNRTFELFSSYSLGTTTDWKHLVLTFNNSNNAKLYIDGILNSSNSTTMPSLSSIDGAIVGAISDIGGRYTHTSYDLVGDVSIVRTYNRALTPQEIQQNYNATKSRFGL